VGDEWNKMEVQTYRRTCLDDLFNRLVTEGILASHCDASSIDNNVLVQ
jgi:hypothetical protein